MKRTKVWSLLLLVVTSLFVSHVALAQVDDDDDDDISGAREPVQFYLQARITDHVNLQITEDRIRRILALIDKYRATRGGANVTVTLLFSGATSEALQKHNAQSHVVDLIVEHVKSGAVEVGYDGSDEPTYKTRPIVEMKVDTPEGRWLARADAAEKLLTQGRDPITGALVPGQEGGLEKMQKVFGPAACITGVGLGVPALAAVMPDFGSDSEAVHQIRRYNTQAVMFGLPEDNPLHSVMYRKWSEAFSRDWNANPVAPPELYWQDGVLRTSESMGIDNQRYLASNGAAAMSYVLKRLDRNMVRVVHIEIGSERNYLTKPFRGEWMFPPTRYAYSHPDHPELPASAFVNEQAVSAAFAREDELIEWIANDYIPDNSGSRFVSNGSLKKLTAPAWGYPIPMKTLRSATEEMLKTWGSQPEPPKYLRLDDLHFLSLAETFQVLADALAEQSRTGKLPETIKVARIQGPLEVVQGLQSSAGKETTAGSVARASAGLVASLHEDTWSPVPKNVIPIQVKVDALDLNPAQFLHLMGEALVAPSPDTQLQVKTANMFSTQDILGMRTRAARDMGVAWTFKPAPLDFAGSEIRAAK